MANILETWRQFGQRATYAIELAKVLDGLRSVAASFGEQPPTIGRPSQILAEVEEWAIALLDDSFWDDTWLFNEEDIEPEILSALRAALVDEVASSDYVVTDIAFDDLAFRNVDRTNGSAELSIHFRAEHLGKDYEFDGHLMGTLSFDPNARTKQHFLASLGLEVQAHFDVGDDAD